MSTKSIRGIFLSINNLDADAVAKALLVCGAGLRIWQYSAGASLWIDEIALARSIIDRSWSALLNAPLSFGQVSPLGFVLVEKLAVEIFGPSDYVLRAFPLLCGLVSLVVFWRLAVLVLGPVGALVALALFTTAAPLVIYSAQVKQYSSDLLVAVWLSWLILRNRSDRWTYGQALGLGMAGFVAAVFSHSAVFVITGVGGALALLDGFVKRQGGRAFRPLTIVLISWSGAAVAGLLLGITRISSGGLVFLPNFWVAGFPPLTLEQELAQLWPWEPLKVLIHGRTLVTLGYRYPVVSLLLMLLGFLWILRINKRQLLVLGAPIGVTLVAAVLRLYPFSDRLILFLLPVFLLFLAAGIYCGALLLARISRPAAVLVALMITGVGVAPILRQPPPYRTEDAKPILAYMQAAYRPGDSIYVYYGAWQAMQFYGPRFGLTEEKYFSGDCYRGDPRRYLAELDQFRGQSRVWLVMLHSVRNYRERDDIVAYLDAIGSRLDYRAIPSYYFRRRPDPAELFLYDMSDSERLGRASAENFAIRGRTTVDPTLPCSIHERPVKHN